MKPLCTFFALIAPVLIIGTEVNAGPNEYSVKENLKNQLKWTMDGATFEFLQDGEKCELKDEAGKLIYTWKPPLQVDDAIASENGRAMLVCVMTANGFYHGITRFVLKNGAWAVDEVMLDDHPDMAIRDRWIRELGAVADDGAEAILHVGETDKDVTPEPQPYLMFYSWQTWDLNKTKRLGVGLKMANARRDNKTQQDKPR